MREYYIETVKCGLTDGGVACGPVPGSVVVTIQYKARNEQKWLSLVEYDGIPNVYLFDKDVHDELAKEDFDDDEFIDYVNNHSVEEFNSIQFDADYLVTYQCMADDPDNPAVPLIKYLIAVVRCGMEDVAGLIEMAEGKYADELDIPVTDVEEEFLEEIEDLD